jgi:hypothetical protein
VISCRRAKSSRGINVFLLNSWHSRESTPVE